MLGRERDDDDITMTVEPQNKVLSDILDENGDEMMTSQAGEGPTEQALQGMHSLPSDHFNFQILSILNLFKHAWLFLCCFSPLTNTSTTLFSILQMNT